MRFNTYINEGRQKDHYRVLKAKVTGYSDGKPLPDPYRVVMFFDNSRGQWKIAPEQSFDGKFNEHSGLPAWDLYDFVIKKPPKEIMIDAGQKWSIKGFDAAAKEALRYI